MDLLVSELLQFIFTYYQFTYKLITFSNYFSVLNLLSWSHLALPT